MNTIPIGRQRKKRKFVVIWLISGALILTGNFIGAKECKAHLTMRSLQLNAAQRGALRSQARWLNAQGTGFSTWQLMRLQLILYQAMGGMVSTKPALVRGATSTLNYMTATLGMKLGAAESRYASLLGESFSCIKSVHPNEHGMAPRLRAEKTATRAVVLGGKLTGLAGARGNSSQFYTLLGKMMASPLVRAHMTPHEMERRAFIATALGLASKEMEYLNGAYGAVK
ncbi:MAG: hypothetical protein M0Z36_08640 [Thermaerobacter sp.]|nr:hypothetical protein [Thermaerobacter sp.]